MTVRLGPLPCLGCGVPLLLVELDGTYPQPRLRLLEDEGRRPHRCPSPRTHARAERAAAAAARRD